MVRTMNIVWCVVSRWSWVRGKGTGGVHAGGGGGGCGVGGEGVDRVGGIELRM